MRGSRRGRSLEAAIANIHDSIAVTTFLFTDIVDSTRLWEEAPDRMARALARHDALARSAVERHRGVVVKMTGDGVHAAFDDPRDAIDAALDLQRGLAQADGGDDALILRVRSGMHAGRVERRDNDYFGGAVNRAARIMSVAHGGQVLVSHAVATLTGGRLPDSVALLELGAVRLRDLSSPERLYQLAHPALRREFPPLRSLESTPNNLPQQLTSFVGRENDAAEVKRLLGAHRLVTLLGVGGIGKTRLTLQVGADVLSDYPEGVWLVELASITDAARVPHAVASVLGVKEEAGRPIAEALVKHVKDRRLLLILDNCEHVVRACAEIAKPLLQAGPLLRILASSREPLHLGGETSYQVPALSIPDISDVPPGDLARFESVRLFVDRVAAAQPSFSIDERNAEAVARICRLLDGIPLALELAAARARALSVESIAARVTDRFRLLVGKDQTLLPRQQTLRALIDWSHDLLESDERTLFRRLSVFAGGWTLEAAETVGAGGDIDAASVVDLTGALVDKSLVVVEAHGERYRLLETIRQYAHDRLEDSGERDDVHVRHCDFYLEFAERARPELVGAEQGAWLARLDAERENLLSAHAWCGREEVAAPAGLRLVSAMRRYWITRGLLGLGYRVTVDALGRPGAQARDAARCDALFDAGQIGSWMGRYDEARSYLQDSLAIAREIGDRRRISVVLQPLARTSEGQGDLAGAREYLEEALALSRDLGNAREIAAAQNALAQICRLEGKLETAEALYRDVLSIARGMGDREIICIVLLNLAMVSIGRGSNEQGRSMLLEVLSIVEEIGLKPAGASLLEVSAGLAASEGEWQRAALYFGAAEAQTGQTGLRRDAADEAFLSPLIANAREALGEAVFRSAESAGGALSYDDSIANARAWLDTPRVRAV